MPDYATSAAANPPGMLVWPKATHRNIMGYGCLYMIYGQGKDISRKSMEIALKIDNSSSGDFYTLFFEESNLLPGS